MIKTQNTDHFKIWSKIKILIISAFDPKIKILIVSKCIKTQNSIDSLNLEKKMAVSRVVPELTSLYPRGGWAHIVWGGVHRRGLVQKLFVGAAHHPHGGHGGKIGDPHGATGGKRLLHAWASHWKRKKKRIKFLGKNNWVKKTTISEHGNITEKNSVIYWIKVL